MANLKKKKRHCLVTERDYKLLRFLWKWKAVSSRALAKKFFPDIQPRSAYRRLEFLEDDGYIGTFEVDGPWHRVWTLRDKGFKHILPKLGELESVGYKSEHVYHDFIATAFHLGEWLTGQPENTQTYSEQQLRRYHQDNWPAWVPRSSLHRPDGYSIYTHNNQRIIVAIEAELSAKWQQRYESVSAFYDSQPSIQYVFWLVDSKSTLSAIQAAFEKCLMRDFGKHQFVLLEDFSESGWMAPIAQGSLKGSNFSKMLHRTGVESTSIWHRDLDAVALLDSRKRPINPSSSPSAPKPQNPD